MKADTMNRHNASVRRVLKHISTNPNDVPSVAQLSRVACVAPFHFHRVFRQMVGEPIGRYIRALRLDYSLYQILFSKDTIIQIALQAGYQSHEAYTRAFERCFGVAPSTLRIKCGSNLPAGEESIATLRVPFASAKPRLRSVAFRTTWLPQRSVLFHTHFGAYADVPEFWKKFRSQLTAAGLSLKEAEPIGILYDDPVRCARVRYDACVAVPESFSGGAGLGIQVLPGINTICTEHRGDYPLSFYTCIRSMNSWTMSGDNRRPALPCYELYRKMPFLSASEDVYLEVCTELK
jgi:AraC family transcriptional regulator